MSTVTIKDQITGEVLFEHEGPLAGANLSGADLQVANLRGADLSRADLNGADLSRANLRGADLQVANLSGADLSRASLSRAVLRWADLSRANLNEADLSRAKLSGADLNGASLSEANLSGASLSGAKLSGASLSRAVLPNGETYEDFIAAMPRLLTAGGKTVNEVAQHWDCHSWENCPMRAAFGASSLIDVPEEWRERANLFVTLFDAGVLPCPQ